MAKRRRRSTQTRYRKFKFDLKKDAYLIEQLKESGWNVREDGTLSVKQEDVKKVAKKFPSVVLNLETDWDDPHSNKRYRFRFPPPNSGDRNADLAMVFLKRQGYSPLPTGSFANVEYDVPHHVAEQIPYIWKYKYSKEWQPSSIPGVEYMVKGDKVRFTGFYTVYREEGEYEVPVKGDFYLQDMEGYYDMSEEERKAWKPTADQLTTQISEEISWFLDDYETSEDAPWNKLNLYGWESVGDEGDDFENVEFTVADDEVTVRGIINGVPIDEIVFDAKEVDDIDWDAPIDSLREHIQNMLVDMLSEMEGASPVPGFDEVRVFLDSGQLSGFLPEDDLKTRMRERMRERMKGK